MACIVGVQHVISDAASWSCLSSRLSRMSVFQTLLFHTLDLACDAKELAVKQGTVLVVVSQAVIICGALQIHNLCYVCSALI